MSRKNLFLFAVAVISAVVVQTSLLPVFVATPFKPDLLLIILVFVALRGTYEVGAPAALLLGLIKDTFSGLYLGLNVFTFIIIFLIIKSVSDRLYAESSYLFVVAVVIATLACLSGNLLLLMFTYTPGIFFSMGIDLIPHLLVNAFVASLAVLMPGFEQSGETA